MNDSQLKEQLLNLLAIYTKDVGTTPAGAFRDILVDLRHIADEKAFDFNAQLDASYQVYLEELRPR